MGRTRLPAGPGGGLMPPMSGLASERCEACRPDSPPVSETELPALRAQVPDWQVVERQGIRRLERTFRFPDFASALERCPAQTPRSGR